MTDENKDWVEYQQTEIDEAIAEIKERRAAVSDTVGHGLLEGSFIQERENQQMQSYLQGYSDALEFATRATNRIDNLAKYALEVDPDGGSDE